MKIRLDHEIILGNKLIPLETPSFVAVDEEDFDLNQFTWYIFGDGEAVRPDPETGELIYMADVVCNRIEDNKKRKDAYEKEAKIFSKTGKYIHNEEASATIRIDHAIILGYRLVPLKPPKSAIVDECDFDLNKFTWYLFYGEAVRPDPETGELIHLDQVIMRRALDSKKKKGEAKARQEEYILDWESSTVISLTISGFQPERIITTSEASILTQVRNIFIKLNINDPTAGRSKGLEKKVLKFIKGDIFEEESE